MVSEGRRGAGRAVVASLAGGDDARQGRRSGLVPPDVGSHSPDDRDRFPEEGRGTPACAAAGTRRHRCAAACSRRGQGTVRRSAVRLACARARAHPARRAAGPVRCCLRIVVRRPRDDLVFVAAVAAAGGTSGAMTSMLAPLPPAVAIAIASAFGAILGSFLNVCIYRLPLRKSVVWPPSACTNCGRELLWYENVPVVSWLALRGRCRTCSAPISIRYPLIEAITAAMFGLAWWYYGPGPLLASRLVFGSALIVLFAIDLEHHLLPNVITLPGILVGFVFSFFAAPGWQSSLIGLLVGGG